MVIIGGTLQRNPFYGPRDEFLSVLRPRSITPVPAQDGDHH